jgi:hypothetical protein
MYFAIYKISSLTRSFLSTKSAFKTFRIPCIFMTLNCLVNIILPAMFLSRLVALLTMLFDMILNASINEVITDYFPKPLSFSFYSVIQPFYLFNQNHTIRCLDINYYIS